MNSAARELPDQPRIDRAECQPSLLGQLARARDMIEQPSHFRPRKICVEHKAGQLLKLVGKPVTPQTVAIISRAPALPDYGVVNRLSRLPVPDDSGLALIGDADSGNLIGPGVRVRKHAPGGIQLRRPDLFGTVFDPSGLRVELFEFLLRYSDRLALAVKQNCA